VKEVSLLKSFYGEGRDSQATIKLEFQRAEKGIILRCSGEKTINKHVVKEVKKAENGF